MALPLARTLLAACLVMSGPAHATHLGRVGPTDPVTEPHMVEEIVATMKEKEASGELARFQEDTKNRAKAAIMTPPPVAGITRATQRRVYQFDPSIRVDEALVDHNGRIVVPAGTVVNPLDYTKTNQMFVFFDARDEDQVRHVSMLLKSEMRPVIVVLTGGSPMRLMESWERRVYFDQKGLMTSRFGIKAVPAIVRRDGLRLTIEEVPPL